MRKEILFVLWGLFFFLLSSVAGRACPSPGQSCGGGSYQRSPFQITPVATPVANGQASQIPASQIPASQIPAASLKNKAPSKASSAVPFSAVRAARKASRKKPIYRKRVLPAPVVLHPENIQWVSISATDVNRIVCSGGKITDVFYSAEKGIKVKVAGHEAYLKLQAKVLPSGEVEYSSIPTEVYVVCAGNTYGFIGRPERIPSRTIYLTNPAANAQKSALYAGDIDKAVVKIVRQVFLDKIPPSWEREKTRPISSPIIGVEIKEIACYRIPGIGVLVRVLTLRPRIDISWFSEKELLDPKITVNPIAISLESTNLKAFKPVRVVIIEKAPEVSS